MKIRVIFKKVFLICISSLLIYYGIIIQQNPSLYRYYNKIIENHLLNSMDKEAVSIIILTVSGDKNYLNKEMKDVYSSNYMLHLLVLSGSNLYVMINFIEFFIFKNSKSSYLIKLALIYYYLLFTNLPHPLARASLFMMITDISHFWGYKLKNSFLFIFLISISIFFNYIFDFSLSFTLSAYFALSVMLYNRYLILQSKIHNFLYFNLYMTVISIPTILFFKSYSPLKAMIIGLFTTLTYDFLVFPSYLIYFAGLIIPRDILRLTSYLFSLYMYIIKSVSPLNLGAIKYNL